MCIGYAHDHCHSSWLLLCCSSCIFGLQLVQSYTHLDLLAPMPDVELDKPRLLMVEGSLHYRDGIKPKVSHNSRYIATSVIIFEGKIE